MKNFDLNACGVQEMNVTEIAEVNGGGLLDYVLEKAIEGLAYAAWETHKRGTLMNMNQGVQLWN